MRRTVIAIAAGSVALLVAVLTARNPPSSATPGSSRVTLKPCHVAGVKEEVRCGVYDVFENRQSRKGRMLPLKVVLIAAKHPRPNDGPIFYMAGGPGEAATELAELVVESGDAEEHDVVLVDERGTGEGHRLDCPSRVSDDNLEAYLSGPFDPAAARACRDELQRKFDLTQYSTPNFVEDIDEIRGAIGYNKIPRRLPAQAHGVSEAEDRPGRDQNDHCEKNELGGHTRPFALGVAFAQEAKSA